MCLLSRQTVIKIYITVLVSLVLVKEVFHLPRRCDYVEFVRSLVFFEKRVGELVKYLMERGYRKAYVESQVDKVRRISWAELLSKSNQPRSTKTPFVVTNHPRLPDISKILRELHPILQSSEKCRNLINSVPLYLWRFGNQRSWGTIWYVQRWRVVGQNICYQEQRMCVEKM